MVLQILRALFILALAAVGWFYLHEDQPLGWLTLTLALVFGVVIVAIDVLSPRKKLALFSGTILGLVVGLLVAYALSFIVVLLVDHYATGIATSQRNALVQYINMVVGIVCVYLAISFIMQTKDDFRFIIPYVEFSRQTKGGRPMLLDTSALIDGRIADVVQTGIIESQFVVPRFVLQELQDIADSSDKLKRNRGRRGLDVLANLQSSKKVDVLLYEAPPHEADEEEDVDQKLMALAKELDGRVMTTDFNLNKVAQLRGVDVINLNDLANALKPVVLPGEKMHVTLIKQGEEPGQGVGYLEDGTMVVVEHGRQHLNQDVEFVVTSVLQTSAGKMIFGRMGDGPPAPHRRQGHGHSRRHESEAPAG
jgi:uncharacterized protein YacL